ncbi:MAG: Gfo/Idh/MocA family oxidoreductase [Lachnospiraceae bacterium]|jgi:scyllo-inositol 2-dehydrogenase (NADP+)|nr:Gfo/Idh/MocA family oxidoreductase [Lachnospiraceae bacterium]
MRTRKAVAGKEQEMMRLGMIGYGGMAHWHKETLEQIEGLELAGIWDIAAKARERAKEEGVRVYESQQDLLAQEDIDLVLIATPNDVHCPIAIAAMEAGKHVVCEKPAALSSQEVEQMMEASQRTGRFLTVHQNRRWDEDFLTVCRILEEQKLGEVFRIESRVHGSRGIPGDWRQEKEKGGGMVLDWGVHLLDQILLMKKGVKLNRVHALTTHVTNQMVDDGFTAELVFADGQQVMVEVGTSNFVSLPRWYVLGSNGTAVIRDWELNGEIVSARGKNEKDVVPVRTAAGLTKTMAPRREDTIYTQELPKACSDIREFYQNVMAVIEGREESRIRLEEVLRVMKLMEAVFESARTKETVVFEA